MRIHGRCRTPNFGSVSFELFSFVFPREAVWGLVRLFFGRVRIFFTIRIAPTSPLFSFSTEGHCFGRIVLRVEFPVRLS